VKIFSLYPEINLTKGSRTIIILYVLIRYVFLDDFLIVSILTKNLCMCLPIVWRFMFAVFTACGFSVSRSKTLNHVMVAALPTKHMETWIFRLTNRRVQLGVFHESFNFEHSWRTFHKRAF